MTCPVCERELYQNHGGHPCRRCWSTLSPAARAPWVRALRQVGPDHPVAHRDPFPYAPPTLQAYVAYLEALCPTTP